MALAHTVETHSLSNQEELAQSPLARVRWQIETLCCYCAKMLNCYTSVHMRDHDSLRKTQWFTVTTVPTVALSNDLVLAEVDLMSGLATLARTSAVSVNWNPFPCLLSSR